MAGLGRKTFAQEEILRAADVNGYLMDQSVMRFADSTARSSAIATATEGMVSYLDSENAVTVFDGSDWQAVGGNFSHNYIINGAFDIWQRGTSFTLGTGEGQYTADRWAPRFTANRTYTITQETFSPAEVEAIGFGDAKHYLDFSFVGTDIPRNGALTTYIEDVRTLAGQTVTVSAWVKSADDAGMLLEARVRQNFGSGGSTTVTTNPAAGNVLTTSWERYEWQINIPSISGKTIGDSSSIEILFIENDGVSVDYSFQIWGVQLEAGSVATPFKRHAPSLQGELAACQRYYQKLVNNTNWARTYGFAASSTAARCFIPLPVQMRATPSIVDAGPVVRTQGTQITPTATTVQTALGAGGIEVSYTVASGLTLNQVVIVTHDSAANASAEL
jgi:hypothetical protein